MTKALTLPARMDYGVLESLHAELRDSRGQELTLDASNVTHLGSCALQLLVSARKSWDQDGQRLLLNAPSDRFRDHLSLLGMGEDYFETAGGPA